MISVSHDQTSLGWSLDDAQSPPQKKGSRAVARPSASTRLQQSLVPGAPAYKSRHKIDRERESIKMVLYLAFKKAGFLDVNEAFLFKRSLWLTSALECRRSSTFPSLHESKKQWQ